MNTFFSTILILLFWLVLGIAAGCPIGISLAWLINRSAPPPATARLIKIIPLGALTAYLARFNSEICVHVVSKSGSSSPSFPSFPSVQIPVPGNLCTICGWCHKHLSGEDPAVATLISTGMCAKCAVQFAAEMPYAVPASQPSTPNLCSV